jgi:YVTN family beta-propeller protein
MAGLWSARPVETIYSAAVTRLCGASRATEDFSEKMNRSMVTMVQAMQRSSMIGNADHDFASMMIPHHAGAIDMAKLELAYGKDTVLRRLAEEIIVDQETEIQAMNLQLFRRGEIVIEPQGAFPILQVFGTTGADQPDLAAPSPVVSTGAPSVSASTVEIPISSRDRVYTGDQTSNTVSVINPVSNTCLGVIRLGDPVPKALAPLYKGALLVHGMGFAPDGKTLAVVAIASNTVYLIDPETNKVRFTVRIGRSPHEPAFTPDGKQLWVSVRGEDYVSVIDPATGKEIRQVKTNDGPAMVQFSTDGKYAFVPSSFVPELCVVDTATYEVIARIKQASTFCPNLAVSRDNREVWLTLKDSGRTQIIRATPPFDTLAVLTTGPVTNHVQFADNANGHFAYVTSGSDNQVLVYRRTDDPTHPQLVTKIPVGDIPHGIWPSGDGTRVYVGIENGDAVTAIDTLANKVSASIKIGQLPQGLVYVPNAVSDGNAGTDGLTPLGASGDAQHVALKSVSGDNKIKANVSLNNLGLLDQLQIVASGLQPNSDYQLIQVDPKKVRGKLVLAELHTNPFGTIIAQSLGPLKQIAENQSGNTAVPTFAVTDKLSGNAILVSP